MCSGLVRDWAPRDACIWCLEPGGTGTGQCRPGGDYGICPTVPSAQQALFAITVQSVCGPAAICQLTHSYTDLELVLGVPTASPTPAPTRHPSPPTPPTGSPTPEPPVCTSVSVGHTRAQAETLCKSAKFAPYCHWVSAACRPKSSG